MAIVENTVSEIGDVIIIKASVPIVGLVTLASFTDSVVNETGAKYFYKEFRFSVDGVNFSTWRELTNLNISSVDVSPTATFIIEYRYTRSGSDNNLPNLEFNQVQLSGDFSEVNCGESYNNSIFAKFFTCTDLCVLSWMINVLEKMYSKGVLPEYITRGDQGNEAGQDDDFMEFWKSISQYFAYIVCYARQWDIAKSTNNYDILIEYLRNQTFFFCGSESVDELKYVMNNTYDEMRKRGTYEIIKTKSDDGKSINGEWHRLFCHLNQCTDWYFSYTSNFDIGWVGDKASPTYMGNYFDEGLTKGYELGESVLDLGSYSIMDTDGDISIVSDIDNNGDDIEVMQITSVTAGNIAGIGSSEEQVSKDDLFKVSTDCDYEITFWAKLEDNSGHLTFGVNTYDVEGNLIQPFGTITAFSGATWNKFTRRATVGRDDRYYFFRGIIYNKNYRRQHGEKNADYKISAVNSNLQSEHLRFNNEDICHIMPYIIFDNEIYGTLGGTINLYDIKVRHLRTEYSTGFEQPSGFIKMKVENFNKKFSNVEAENYMREFLLPYNSTHHLSFINSPENTNIEEVLDIIQENNGKWTNPTTSGVREGDRYLVWNGNLLELYQYYSSMGWVSTDNEQGKIVYVVGKLTTFKYETDRFIFSSK